MIDRDPFVRQHLDSEPYFPLDGEVGEHLDTLAHVQAVEVVIVEIGPMCMYLLYVESSIIIL